MNELKDGVLSLEAFSLFDKQVLQDWIFPILFEAGRKTPPRARWTNGDFYGANILRNAEGDIRLIDCEFARVTHFFQTDSFRLREFSVLPSGLGIFPFGCPKGNMPLEGFYFWLQHVQMLHLVVRPQFFLNEVPMIMERVLTLACELRQDASQIQGAWSAARKQARSIAFERDALRGERDALSGERDALSGERDALRLRTIEFGERIAKLDRRRSTTETRTP